MEEILKQILSEVHSLKTGQQQLITEVSSLKSDVSDIKGQLTETNDIVKALLHRTEELDAKMDGLAINTASKEAVADLDAKFEVLNARLFHQEAELYKLKAVK